MPRSRLLPALLPGLLPLLLVLACRPPAAVPGPEPTAAAAARGAGDLPEARRQDYVDGFLNGAEQVRAALREGRKPYLPRFGEGQAAPVLLGALPEGARVVEGPPRPEVDPATGLQLLAVREVTTVPYARGQVEGFAWALGTQAAALSRAALVQPRTLPGLPGRWEPWPREAGQVTAVFGETQVEVRWLPGVLAWQAVDKGFPAARRWRPVPGGWEPRFVAVRDRALWVETAELGAVALDLDTGAVLDARPAQPHEDGERSLRSWYDAQRAELRKPDRARALAALRKRAKAGEAQAMYELSRLLVPDESEDGLCPRFLWTLEAARRGQVQAMMELAAIYYGGLGVAVDPQEARLWSRRAADTGDPQAVAAFAFLFPSP
jgi:hypothetical protein